MSNINHSGTEIEAGGAYFSGERFRLIADSEFLSQESGEYIPVQYVMPFIEVERVPNHILKSEGEPATFEYVFRIYDSGSLFYSIVVDERTEKEREEEKGKRTDEETRDVKCSSSPFEPEEKSINLNITVDIKEDFNPDDLLKYLTKAIEKSFNKGNI